MASKAAQQDVEITVRIGAFPGGQIKPYTFKQGATYEEGLTKANLKGGGDLDVRANGERLSNLDGAMQDGDQVLVFSKVRGN